MSLLEQINNRIQKENTNQIAKSMGYNNPYKFKKRLDKLLVVNHLDEWMEISEYDFVHSNESFLIKLCDCLSLAEDEVIQIISKIKTVQQDLSKMPQPYIFVNTNFKRKNEPIFALAFLEGKRNLLIPKKLVYYSADEGMSHASKMVKEHYHAQLNGELLIWGNIDNYIYHVNHKKYVFNRDGQLMNENCQIPDESNATLFVGGNRLPI